MLADAAGLLTLPEGQYFERKSGRISPKDLAIPLVAMANAEGGAIVVGLHDGMVDGVEPARVNALRQAAMDHTAPPVPVSHEERVIKVGGMSRTVLVMRVEPSDTLHSLTNGTAYLRVGDESRKLSAAQRQELAYDRGAAAYEGSPMKLTIEDLDQTQLGAYASALGAASVRQMLLARDLLDRRGRVTVAACLLFDERPQREYPNAVVRVLRYGDTDPGLGARMSLEDGRDIRFEGSLPHQIIGAAAEIDQLMPKWQRLGEGGVFEATPRIPRDAWLEGLVNAVVHRSYSIMGDHIRVEIFPNRIQITSPGRFPGLVDPARPLEIDRYARNPRISRVCSDLGVTRELGEGIRRMFDEMRRRGLADPIYTQMSSSVRLVLVASDAVPQEILSTLTPSARAILEVLRVTDQPLGTGQLAELAGISRMTATRGLSQLRDVGLVGWHGVSAKDPRATWRLR
ncbi:MAG: putative DNA binding domain-containing protein [Actinomycetales bacterium]|nr:putative DNA binding domain-containing protein [Actinomycetales bacterium]